LIDGDETSEIQIFLIVNPNFQKDPSKYGNWLELKLNGEDLKVTVLMGNQKVSNKLLDVEECLRFI